MSAEELPGWLLPGVFDALPVSVVVIRARDLLMVTANRAYLADVGKAYDDIAGHRVFDVFPNSPLRSGHDQETDLRSFMATTVATGRRQDLNGLRYDIPTENGFDVRYWNLLEVPIRGPDGHVEYFLHYSVDVTDLESARESGRLSQRAADTTSQRLIGLTDIALALAQASTLQELEEIVVRRGTGALGAADGSIVTLAEDGGWQITVDPRLDAASRELYHHVPYDSPYPGCEAARTGQTILLPDEAAGLAFHPVMAEVYARRHRKGWAFIPLLSEDTVVGVLSVSWADEHVVDNEERAILHAFAAQIAQGVHRLQALETERRTARKIAQMAHILQEAMLSEPAQVDGLQVEVRYQSAEDTSTVGGDWYDAFTHTDGCLILAIGDVAGHDQFAAATMGQLRVLLRGLAYSFGPGEPLGGSTGYSPAAVLSRFESVADGLGLNTLVTAVLARVSPPDSDGTRDVRWSNAGNLPPVLVTVDGRVSLLAPEADLVLGVDPAIRRYDHAVELATGDTLLMFTDGLVERRAVPIDAGLDHLVDVLGQAFGLPLDGLCDVVLTEMAPFAGEDDVALIAVRNG